METLTMKSSVSFRRGITVELYKKEELIEKQYLGFCLGDTPKKTYLIVGIMYITLSLTVLNNFFLPIGVVFLILGLTATEKTTCSTKKEAKRLE